MNRRKLLGFLLAAGMASLSGQAVAQTALKIGYVLPATSHYGYAVSVLASEVAKRTEGRYRLEAFPSGALGGEREMVEGAQLGTLGLVLTSTGPVTNFVPEVGILDLPFLFRDAAHAHQVLDSKIGQDLLAKFPSHGLVGLAWTDQSFRHLTNSRRPVVTPEDVKGLKVRTMENPVHILSFRTVGANPTPMAFPEVFGALQQGAIDGQEQAIAGSASTKMSQVQKYLSLTGHFFSPAVFIMSPKAFNNLSSEDKENFLAAARAASMAMREYMREADAKGIEQMRKDGMEVNENVDKEKFQAAFQPAYAEFAKKYGQENIDAIRAVGLPGTSQ
ncbi:TRAP transporter substrate-binding protein [Pseudochelatococcus lubricantis]|uniref:TRAP transporter substrate-binding protein n=1 Tax=Pseudochelatococcus lubricantis TaxID=1538102 RepID=UPI0035E4A40E